MTKRWIRIKVDISKAWTLNSRMEPKYLKTEKKILQVQYAITDVVVMVREVADHQVTNWSQLTLLVTCQHQSWKSKAIIRTFCAPSPKRSSSGSSQKNRCYQQGQGLDEKKKLQVSKLVKEKNICASEIMSDLNRQVRKWGLDVRYFNLVFKSSPLVFRCVSLSEAKVLKKPEGNNGIAPLLQVAPVLVHHLSHQQDQSQKLSLQSLGMKEKSSYPSPMEFARWRSSN